MLCVLLLFLYFPAMLCVLLLFLYFPAVLCALLLFRVVLCVFLLCFACFFCALRVSSVSRRVFASPAVSFACLCYLLSLLPAVSATCYLCYLLSLLPAVSATCCLVLSADSSRRLVPSAVSSRPLTLPAVSSRPFAGSYSGDVANITL